MLYSVNKQLLLNVERFLEVIVDSLLLDPEHPKTAQPDFETVKIPVQRVRCERPVLGISRAPKLICYCGFSRISPKHCSSSPYFRQDEKLCSQVQLPYKLLRKLRSAAGARRRDLVREGRFRPCPIVRSALAL